MDLKKFFKPYLYLIDSLGIFCIIYSIFLEKSSLNLFFLIIAVFVLISSYFDILPANNAAFNLSVATNTFVIISFGILPAILLNSIELSLLSYKRYKRNETETFSIVKLVFNIAQTSICIFVVYSLKEILDVNVFSTNGLDIIKLAVLYVSYVFINTSLVSLVISFSTGSWMMQLFDLRKYKAYYSMSILLLIAIVWLYADRGAAGVILVYSISIPLQRYSQMYTKLKIREEELFQDEMTNIYNGKFLNVILNNKILNNKSFYAIIIGIDNYRYVYKEYGKEISKVFINNIVNFIISIIQEKEYIFRYNEDTLILLIDGGNKKLKGAEVSNKIKDGVGNIKLKKDKISIIPKLSIGMIYENDTQGINYPKVIEKLEKALELSRETEGQKIGYYN
ncbi:hypothetical protein Q428_00270 [Fervidicella metallireducens AeB]|uniref:GGDEF domain-containing protein n=1 Tax=Fervidicella metallireducens AeB TaxID=1403537 RepID=A0A017S111_9CLOT|nr:diguanylate cyclase [Fervidicella metallireducens]EYE89865.1 hypothetical protein Q428_00270 [Fervidicella metallireducens AeB]